MPLFLVVGGSTRHIPNGLSSKGPNYQRGVLLIPADELQNILKEKKQTEIH